MNELLMGQRGVVINDYGDEYLGEVLASDFITGDALASLVGLTGGYSRNSNTNWLKYRSEGKILYVSKKTIRSAVTWNMLNAANVIDGSRIITIGQYQYRIGLLKGLNPDTSVPFTNGYDVASGLNSEWNRLLYPVAIDLPNYPKTSQTIDNWASFPQNDSADGLNITAGYGNNSWCQEVNPTTPANRVYRGGGSVTRLRSTSSSSTTDSYGWRVRLELIEQHEAPEFIYSVREQKELFDKNFLFKPADNLVASYHPTTPNLPNEI